MAKRPSKPAPKRNKAKTSSPKRKSKKRLTGKEKREAQKKRLDNPLLNTKPWYERQEILLAAIAMLMTFLVYIRPLDYGYVYWDDPDYVIDNPLVLNPSGENIARLWSEKTAHNYHPLTMTSLALTVKFFGTQENNSAAFYHHLFNILLHVLNVLLVFMFVRRFSKGNNLIAFFVAFVFGVHPMHVESVAWVTERKDVLFTLFFVWAMTMYLKFLDQKESKYFIFTLVLFVLSLFSKPTSATFFAVLLLLDYYYERPLLDAKVLLEKLPFLIGGIIIIYITYQIQKEEAVGDFDYYTIWQRITFTGYGFMMYIVKLFVPIDLVAFYPYPPKGETPILFAIAPFVSLTIGGLAIYSMRKTRLIAFGIGFYLATIILTLQFVTVGMTVMSDRYTYISYIGLLIILGYGLDYLVQIKPKLKMPIYGATAVVMLIWAFAGFQRTQVWENDFTLWDDVIKKYPKRDAGSYMNRGKYFKNNGDAFRAQGKNDLANKEYELALADFNTAISLDNRNHKTYNNRGNIYFNRNQDDLALENYNIAIELNPNVPRYYDNRGAIHARNGRLDPAIADFKKAIQLNPGFANTYKNLAVTLSGNGNPAEAAKYFGSYLSIFPNDHGILHARAIENQKAGNYQAALQDLNKAIRLAPNAGLYYTNRALVYLALRNKQQGLADIQKALSLNVQRTPRLEQLINQLNAL